MVFFFAKLAVPSNLLTSLSPAGFLSLPLFAPQSRGGTLKGLQALRQIIKTLSNFVYSSI